MSRYGKVKTSPEFAQESKRIFETGRCFYCDCPLVEPVSPSATAIFHDRMATIDHFYRKQMKKNKRHTREPRNLVLCCLTCNQAKRSSDPIEFGMFALIHIKPIRNELEKNYHLLKRPNSSTTLLNQYLRIHRNMKKSNIPWRPVERIVN